MFVLILIPVYYHIFILSFPDAFAHNNSNIVIPIASNNILLDGEIGVEEWEDAFQINFTSPRIGEGNVLVYFKYDLTDKALAGAFFIPDKTYISDVNVSDQIALLFDITHAAGNTTTTTDHSIVFLRDGRGEYYTGLETSNSVNGGSNYKSVVNMSASDHTMRLTEPFSSVDLNIIPNSNRNLSWQGEFKIHFNTDPRLYGFAIQQLDFHISPEGEHERFFINFPAKHTQADIPASWGDISFVRLNEYVKNIELFCPNKAPSISLNNIGVLCLTLNPSTIEENTPTKLIVSGSLGNLINGTGVVDGINAHVANSEGVAVSDAVQTSTNNDGTFVSSISDVNLGSGIYNVLVKPTSEEYEGLNSTSQLVVGKHIPTIEESVTQLGTYLGVIAAGVGVAAFLPSLNRYFVEKKQRNNLVKQISDISSTYDTMSGKKEQCLKFLSNKRVEVLKLLQQGQISQGHYEMLDDNISELEERIRSTID